MSCPSNYSPDPKYLLRIRRLPLLPNVLTCPSVHPWYLRLLFYQLHAATSSEQAQINSSFLFLLLQAFLIANAATDTIVPFTLRADFGQSATQRIQEIHFPESAVFKFSLLIACAGQFFAHRPQLIQSFVAFGTRPAPPAFL